MIADVMAEALSSRRAAEGPCVDLDVGIAIGRLRPRARHPCPAASARGSCATPLASAHPSVSVDLVGSTRAWTPTMRATRRPVCSGDRGYGGAVTTTSSTTLGCSSRDPSAGTADAALVTTTVAWLGRRPRMLPPPTPGRRRGPLRHPRFVDSHSHLMFAGIAQTSSRRIREPYAAGGIRRTVRLTRAASDLLPTLDAWSRCGRKARPRSRSRGYGLTVEDEVRALRLASQL